MKTRLLIAALITLVVVGPQSAHAGTARYTRGDAQAMLNTYPTNTQFFTRGAEGLDIRPSQELYGENPYCVDDWHVLALAWWGREYIGEGPSPDPFSFETRDKAWAFLVAVETDFVLDGVAVEVERGPIGQMAWDDEPLFRFWGVQAGRILAPGELSVGDHTLHVTLTYVLGTFSFTFFDDEVTFTVSPSASSACTT